MIGTFVMKELRWMARDENFNVKFISYYLVNLCEMPASTVAMSFLQQTHYLKRDHTYMYLKNKFEPNAPKDE